MSLLSFIGSVMFSVDISDVNSRTGGLYNSICPNITSSGDITHDGDWSYLFMPEPIAGGTSNIEEMYK